MSLHRPVPSMRVCLNPFGLSLLLAACGQGVVNPLESEAVTSQSTRPLATCNDTPPDTTYTCQQQRDWGKCSAPWMAGHCQTACGTCQTPPPSTCNDTPPDTTYTCQQQRDWGKCSTPWMAGHCQTVCGTCGGTTPPPPGGTAEGIHVSGRNIYDRCGEKLVLRGVNEMTIWSPWGRDGLPEFEEIAKTGANTVRIVWNSSGSAGELDTAIANALNNHLIPMIENHDATGDLWKVSETVNYWTRSDIVQVIQKHKNTLLLNIANEAGNGNDSDDSYKNVYRDAIRRIRDAGITVALVIDAAAWGQATDQLYRVGNELLQSDPLRNVIFSAHFYFYNGADASKINQLMNEFASVNFPIVIGEFANTEPTNCSGRTDYRTLMARAKDLQIGWYAWSWGASQNHQCPNDFNMSDGWYSTLRNWGLEVAVTDAHSIQNTSSRPRSITVGSCQ